MYFTKSFRVVMSDLYLAYCVPQGDLGLLCCAHGTELLSRSTSLVLKQTKNKQLLKSESTPVALLRRPSSLWRSQRCLTPTEMSPRHTHTPALAILSHEVELKQRLCMGFWGHCRATMHVSSRIILSKLKRNAHLGKVTRASVISRQHVKLMQSGRERLKWC